MSRLLDPLTSTIDRIEVITSVQRRRRWTAEEKRRIVEETYLPGNTVSLVARRHDEAAESLRGPVRHRGRLRQDFDDRVRQPHRVEPEVRRAWSISASPGSPTTSAASTACPPPAC